MPWHAVSTDDLEARLLDLQKSTPNPQLGVFGPGSVSWKVNRESALFLAAGRAALLQLAHPWVAAAIAEHSRTLNDPIGRFHNTFRVMFTISFGPLEQAFAAARHLHRLHENIRGTLPQATGCHPANSSYQANESAALAWVFATLVDSSLLAYELALPPLTPWEREQYYTESLKSAALFGLGADDLPSNLAGFHSYLRFTLQSDKLGVSAAARRLAHQLQNGSGLPVSVPFWYRALTLHLLPPRFRDEFQLRYGEREHRASERALHWIRGSYPHLPSGLRFVGPYNEVQQRLRGRFRPTLAVRLSNRIWVGQPALF
ncbi:MAG TPA: oxygenase MpaB family protein [Bryocella sp.]|nr:oxygenase MpaB family protein [Bryocella sp.]